MSDPFIGEVRMFGGNFAPVGWALCQGQMLPISQNDALFALIGTTFGGDGQENFGLPDMRGRAPLHVGAQPGGSNYTLGLMGGVESVTLTSDALAIHTHSLTATTNTGNSPVPTAQVYGQAQSPKMYTQDTATKFFAASVVGTAGGGQPHDNMQPYTVVSFIIALAGIYPQQG